MIGTSAAAAGATYLLGRLLAPHAEARCADEYEQGVARCARWEDQGYSACARYEDQGYRACDRYEDQGYNTCAQWEQRCCDWIPCSWLCKLLVWICVAWVWVSNWVCVAWVWISNIVCVAWVWISRWVCTLWVRIVNLFCWWRCFIRRLFAPNEVWEVRSECIYGWTAAYQITESARCELNVVLRIRLNPDAGVTAQQLQAAQTTWEQGIEQTWTDQFRIRRRAGNCPCAEYRVTVDVQWVASGEHHTVRIRAGAGRADMTNWFITDTGGTVAHEAGHMFGNVDEYADANCPNRTVTNDNSIMQTTAGTVRPRHYQRFAEWVSNRTCCEYEVAT